MPQAQKTRAPRAKKPKRYHTDEQLRQLAVDTVAGKVFYGAQLKNLNLSNAVFMPLAFLTKAAIRRMEKNEVADLYEYLSEAGPRSINGYPMFTSCRQITRADTEVLGPLLVGLYEQREKFLGVESAPKPKKARARKAK